MSWITWVFVVIIIMGIVLFLYGANYYEATVGWTGVSLLIAGILAFLIRYIYNELKKS